jgi:acyl-CoA synthetase (AMP-forming)/AMP-acid ligase II
MFHCFGLVLGVLAVLSHGASIVFPSETFDPGAVIKSLTEERCTGLHGVPAMFTTVMKLLKPGMEFPNLRTGIAAGAPVSKQMMEELNEKLHMPETTITYGKSNSISRDYVPC